MAKYFSRQAFSQQISRLTKALESVSTNLSILAIFGLALVPMVPQGSASPPARADLAAMDAPAPAPAVAAPVEVIRAKPVPVRQVPELQFDTALHFPRTPPPLAAEPEAEPLPEADAEAGFSQSARVLARVTRERRRRSRRQKASVQSESGELGKAAPVQAESGEAGKAGRGTRTASNEKIPVPDAKVDAEKVEPPEPEEWSAGEIIAALKDCLKRIAPLGADIEVAAPVKQDQCGNPAPVLLKRIGSGPSQLEFQPPPMLNCAMVASLHTWVEKTLQPAAQETLGTSIKRVRGAAGYACRNRNGTRHNADRLSEHAHANAIDIMGFVTADGRNIDVLSKWGPTVRDMKEELEKLAEAKAEAQRTAKEAANAAREAARAAEKEAAEAARAARRAPAAKRKDAKAEAERKKAEAKQKREEAEEKENEARRADPVRSAKLSKLGRGDDTPVMGTSDRLSDEANFLRRLHKGACTAFGTVLGPEANEAHRNHFHFDLAPRRRSAYCQ